MPLARTKYHLDSNNGGVNVEIHFKATCGFLPQLVLDYYKENCVYTRSYCIRLKEDFKFIG